MKTLSTGQPSTLGSYLENTLTVMGEGKAAEFLRAKIAASPRGEQEEVLADETQMLGALVSMQFDLKGK